MDKYILLGDTHLGTRKASDTWHNITLDFFKEISDVCVKRGIDTVIHLGDFFHDRKHLNVKTIDIAYEIENILQDINMYIVIGNHDSFYKDQLYPSTIQIFKNSQNIHIVDKITYIDNIILVPWLTSPSEIPKEFIEGSTLMGHFAIRGFLMNDSITCNRGLDASEFEGFKYVYSGHFHTPSMKGNIKYIGAPYAQTFHDADGIRGYYVFEDEDLKFIEYKGAPRFTRIYTDSDIDEVIIKGNIVKVTFTEDYGTVKNESIMDNIKKFKPLQLYPDFSNIADVGTDDDRLEESASVIIDNVSIMKEYIEKSSPPTNIKKKTVLEIIENIIEEVSEY